MPPAAIVAGAIVAGAAIQYLGNRDQAEAQGNAARAQQLAALQDRDLAMQSAQPSTMELEQIHREIQLNEAAINRQEKLLDAVDPALIEAGQQALKLLRGEESSTLDPIRQERNLQRNKLVSQLRDRFGTGAEETTAGADALNKFDQQTAGLLTNAQQSTLKDLLSVASGSRPNPYAGAQIAADVTGRLGQLQDRQIGAINKTPVAGYAGAPFVQAAADARNTAELGKGISMAGLAAAGSSGGSGGGSTSAAPSSSMMVGTSQQLPAEERQYPTYA